MIKIDFNNNNVKAFLIAFTSVFISFSSWVAVTIDTTKSKVILLERDAKQTLENKQDLKLLQSFLMNARLKHENHELRIELLEKNK